MTDSTLTTFTVSPRVHKIIEICHLINIAVATFVIVFTWFAIYEGIAR